MKTKYITSQCLFLLFAMMVTKTSGDLSEQCIQENLALSTNTDLQDAVFNANCDIQEGRDSCSLDMQTMSGNFEETCLEEGGAFHETDIVFDCNVPAFPGNPNADYFLYNYPLCIGVSCDVLEVEEVLETEQYPLWEREMAQQGFQCTISEGSNSQTALFSLLLASSCAIWISFL